MEENKVIQIEQPKQTFTVQMTEEKRAAMFHMLRGLRRRNLLMMLGLSALVGVVAVVAMKLEPWAVFLLGVVLAEDCYLLLNYLRWCARWKKDLAIGARRLDYELYSDYFTLNCTRHGDVLCYEKVEYKTVEQVQRIGAYLFISTAWKSYPFVADEVGEDCIFYTLPKSKQKEAYASGKNSTVSVLLIIGAILGLIVPILLLSLLPGLRENQGPYMWLFLLFTPLSLAVIGFGFYLKSKGYNYKREVIFGAAILFIQCVYGTYSIWG